MVKTVKSRVIRHDRLFKNERFLTSSKSTHTKKIWSSWVYPIQTLAIAKNKHWSYWKD